MSLLGLQLPCTSQQAKSRFRELAFKLHPDHGGSAAQFRALKAEYDNLMATNQVVDTVATTEKYTVEGFPLQELGLGLGPNINGRICVECAGNGYQTFTLTTRPRRAITHHDCRGYGCYGCNFRGHILWEGHPVHEHTYYKCNACDGKGEIRLYNPVIPKGRIL